MARELSASDPRLADPRPRGYSPFVQCARCQTKWPAEIAPLMKFCGACGVLLEGPDRRGADFTPGELRYATVLFADLVGFTAFAEDRSPDDVAKVVWDLLQSLGEVIERHGGAVDKFIGDSVMATFGLMRSDANAARNAVRAGLAMHARVAGYHREQGVAFELRVGVHAGDVMLQTMGGNWTVIGDTVNTASRIQGVTTPRKVWVSRGVYEEVRRFFVLLAQEPVPSP